MANCVDASVHAMQLPALEPIIERLPPEPSAKNLSPRDDTVLTSRQVSELEIE